jgi:hypothetical protein
MGQFLARVLYASALAGCSIIYNPSNLPNQQDAAVDAPVADANPALLQLSAVKSSPLLEGAGQGGSAPQLLVVYGMHITKQAQVKVEPTTANPNVMLQVSDVSIADDGNSFAANVRAGYMDNADETGANAMPPIELTITVTQDGADPKTITWSLLPLDEFAMGAQPAPAAGKIFSRADVTGGVAFTGANKAIVKVVGNINITMAVQANATDQTAGPGGCNGAASNADATACFGGGKAAGGGAGFANAGVEGGAGTAGSVSGDELVKVYDGIGAEMNRGAGGGGGNGAAGGGGGGTIEFTAGGDLNVASLVANGGAGGVATLALSRGGGGGSGGVVVLRSGGMLTLPTSVTLNGGAGGAGVLGSGGAGSIGRWRYDAVTVTGAPSMTPPPRRGPMLVRPANAISESKDVNLMLAGKSGDAVTLITLHDDGTSDSKEATMTSDLFPVVPPPLKIGINTICVIVPNGNFANDEAKNCIEMAFIP